MDDIVRSAVRTALARDASISVGAPHPTLTRQPEHVAVHEKQHLGSQPEPESVGNSARKPRENTLGVDGPLKAKGALSATSNAGSTTNPSRMSRKTSGRLDDSVAVEKSRPTAKRSSSGGRRTKVVNSNWAALRKSMSKAGSGVTKRRPRPRQTQEDADTLTARNRVSQAPMSCSMFVKGALRTGSNVKPTRVVALDCEFVGVGSNGDTDALARVSVVNFRGEVLYDAFVRVDMEVVDFRTRYSGIRPEDITGPSAVDPREARTQVAELLKGRILVGHAVGNDLRVLRINHPQRDVRDTSVFYKRLWKREGRRGSAPPALRLVVARVLGVDQFQTEEHDSCEDARAALALYKKNAKEWESLSGKHRGAKAGKGKKSKSK